MFSFARHIMHFHPHCYGTVSIFIYRTHVPWRVLDGLTAYDHVERAGKEGLIETSPLTSGTDLTSCMDNYSCEE